MNSSTTIHENTVDYVYLPPSTGGNISPAYVITEAINFNSSINTYGSYYNFGLMIRAKRVSAPGGRDTYFPVSTGIYFPFPPGQGLNTANATLIEGEFIINQYQTPFALSTIYYDNQLLSPYVKNNIITNYIYPDIHIFLIQGQRLMLMFMDMLI